MKDILVHSYKNSNNHSLLFGSLNHEKETLAKYEILKLLNENKHVIVFDFHNQFTDFCRPLGAHIIQAESDFLINPLEMFFYNEENDEGCNLNLFIFQKFNLLKSFFPIFDDNKNKFLNDLEKLYKDNKEIAFYDLENISYLDKELIQEYKKLFPTKRTSNQFNEHLPHLTVISFSNIENKFKNVFIHTYLHYFYHLLKKHKEFRVIIDDFISFCDKTQITEEILRYLILFRHSSYRGVQINCSSLKHFMNHECSRFLSFCDTFIVLKINEEDVLHLNKMLGEEIKNEFSYLTKENKLHLGVFSSSGFISEHCFNEIFCVMPKIEDFLSKKSEVPKLSKLSGKIELFYTKFENILGENPIPLIDGVNVKYFLENAYLDKKNVEINFLERE